jgi:5S rRNA maturation endonuclease (ribonuclease M5)
MSEWRRVNRTNPCPICGKADWCTRGQDGLARCMRIRGLPPPGWEIVKLDANDGTIYRGEGVHQRWVYLPPPKPKLSVDQVGEIMRGYQDAMSVANSRYLASKLGLNERTIWAIGTGWSKEHHAHAFPMRDAAFWTCGIRFRSLTKRYFGGNKPKYQWSYPGGREGMFLFTEDFVTRHSPIVCEGPTDAMALWQLGFYPIGRAACSGTKETIVQFIKNYGSNRTLAAIIIDNDPVGSRAREFTIAGAKGLQEALFSVVGRVPIILPPVKDVREWVNRGATRADVLKAIEEQTKKPLV